MIYEVAELMIDPADARDFEAAVDRCAPLFRRAKGCRGMSLERTIETAGRYLLRVEWDTVEDHMVAFRKSEDFSEWRREAGPFFVQPPVVLHSEVVRRHF